MSKTAWSLVGWATHALFGVTVYYLFLFLRGPDVPPEADGSERRATLLVDLVLALQFALPHSLLLLPGVRRRLTAYIPGPMYGVFFCLCTCASLSGVFVLWRPAAEVVWNLRGFGRVAVQTAFYASWVALFYSLRLTGLGFQTGWTPWRAWLRERDAPREFHPRSIYRVLRHPVYFSFLGLIWFTPVLTLDRAVLAVVWTAYIFVGSWLKDRRLEFYLGAPYREYAARVPGYPGMPFGPLARRDANSWG